MLDQQSIHAWIMQHNLKQEKGEAINFKDHLFLYQPYSDLHPKQAILKAAQIGFSTLAILKTLWIAKQQKLDIIYCLPTDDDVIQFVSGKVNRMISQNQILQSYTKDKDSVEQKHVGESVIYYRGSWSKKAAIMVSADLVAYDEVDASKQSVIEEYSTRLQHSKYKWEWFFSHPSAPNFGVDKYWLLSDQHEWYIICSQCSTEQQLVWPYSIDRTTEEYICTHCKQPLTRDDRRVGTWKPTFPGREFRGYHISLLMAPYITAKEILRYYRQKSEEYFYNKVLGLPFVGSGNKLSSALLHANFTEEDLMPAKDEFCIVGVDTGAKIDWVFGGAKGIARMSRDKNYAAVEEILKTYPHSYVYIDFGGDKIHPQELAEKYPGRVIFCQLGQISKGLDMTKTTKRDNVVFVDRTRIIQQLVNELTAKRIPISSKNIAPELLDTYTQHWEALTRVPELDQKTNLIKRHIWVRSSADHLASATWFWRVGIEKFMLGGGLYDPGASNTQASGYEITPFEEVTFNPVAYHMEHAEDKSDWRDTY